MEMSNSLRIFFDANLSEISRLISSVSHKINYKGPIEDVMQNLYVRMDQHKVLRKYDRRKAKMSTYLYQIIHNIMLQDVIDEAKHKFVCTSSDPQSGEDDNGLEFIMHNAVNPDYESMSLRNSDARLDELKDFYRKFVSSSRNKKHRCDRRKNKNLDTEGFDLAELFVLLYRGYTSHEIAGMYGVTDMTLSHAKAQLAEQLGSFGIELPVTAEISEAELDDYRFI